MKKFGLIFSKIGKKSKQWNVWQIYQHDENFDAVARARGPESMIFWPYLLRSILIDCFLLTYPRCINSEQMMLFREIPFLYKGFTYTNGIFFNETILFSFRIKHRDSVK